MRRLKRSVSFETNEEVDSNRNLIRSGENLASNSNMLPSGPLGRSLPRLL